MAIIQGSALDKRITRELAEKSQTALMEYLRIREHYDGDSDILANFLDRFGSDSPFDAASNAVLKSAIFRSPKEIDSIQKQYNVQGKSDSGHKLKQQLYLLSHRYDITRNWVSGSQAITKIMEAFGTPEQQKAFTDEGRQEISERKRKRAEESLDDIVRTLDEVISDPKRLKSVQSINDRTKVHAILGLDEELKKRMQKLDGIIYGNTAFTDKASPSYLLAADSGGRFFGWFERNIESLPLAIRDIFTDFRDPHIEHDENESRFRMGALIAYAAANVPIRRDAAIGSYQKDLDLMMGLSDTHPIIEKYGKPDLTGLRDIFGKTEITLIEATRIFDAYPIDEIRQAVNSDYHSLFGAELGYATSRLDSEFIKDGRWLPDAAGVSVPMARLKESLYSAVLVRDDFKAVRDYLRLETLSAKDTCRMKKAVAIADFKALVDDVAKASRKMRYMDYHLEDEHPDIVAQIPEGDIVLQIKERLKDTQKIMPRGKAYDIVEHFEEEFWLSIDEYIARQDFIGGLNGKWPAKRGAVAELAGFGLYQKDDWLVNEVSAIRSLVAKESIMDDLLKAEKAVGDPMYLNRRELPIGNESKPYFNRFEAEQISRLSEVQDHIAGERELFGESEISALLRMRNNYQNSKLINGTIKDAIECRKERARVKDTEDIYQHTVFSPRRLKGWLEETLGNYREFDHDIEHWKRKAQFVVSRDAYGMLQDLGLGIADTNTWNIINSIGPGNFIEKGFTDAIENIYQRMEKVALPEYDIIAGDIGTLEKALLPDTFSVTAIGTTYGDRGRFKKEFPEFFYRGPKVGWQPETERSKHRIAEISKRISDYNSRYNASIRLKVE